MAISKLINYLLFLCICFSLFACNENVRQQNSNRESSVIFNDTISLNENLKKISLEFINTYKIDNSIIEIDIDKKEYNQIYISLSCRGFSYFLVKKLTPLFTYELKNNSFFVFTGAEELFTTSLDTSKYTYRRQERCDSIIKSCYFVENNKIIKEENCSYPEPFSNLPAALSPPNKNE